MINNLGLAKAGGAAFETIKLFENFPEKVIPSLENPKNILVCSAKKGITRLLMSIAEAVEVKNYPLVKGLLDDFFMIHNEIILDMPYNSKKISKLLEKIFNQLCDCVYSQGRHTSMGKRASIIQYGELVNSKTFSSFLNSVGVKNKWFDSRMCIKTYGTLSNARIKEFESEQLINKYVPKLLHDHNLLITPGFICKDWKSGENSLLKLDGSDITAAKLADSLIANIITYFKDVYGVCGEDNPTPEHTSNIFRYIYLNDYEEKFHDKKAPVDLTAIRTLSRKEIRTLICSFLNPSWYGTEIVYAPQIKA